MYSFTNDYSEGAHPRIMQALMESNLLQSAGYGLDSYSMQAADLIKTFANAPKAAVHFLIGGTSANLIGLAAFLRPHQAVIAADTGHIAVHETGAIEASGHKVITIAATDGKLTPDLIQPIIDTHTDEHMVQPKLVYISNTTEIGTIYTAKELAALACYCKKNQLLLHLDGARLGSALTAEGNDLTIEDIAALVDSFYIGGTKNGALFGEAMVICNPGLQQDFRYHIKQRGGMLAKGRLLGIQFLELFKDDLYFTLAAHANKMAMKMKAALIAKGYALLCDAPSNQLFLTIPNTHLELIGQDYTYSYCAPVDSTHSLVRFVTSWATPEEEIDKFITLLTRI